MDLYSACVKRYRAWIPSPVRELVGAVRSGPIWKRQEAQEGPWFSHAYERGRWDREYRSERWQYMRELPELARYSVLAGYAQFFCPGGSILDLGCGEGILAQRMRGVCYRQYLGVDISALAVAQARARGLPNSEFQCADVASFEPQQKFDAIVFNELLYYLPDPVPVMRRYERHLAPDGVFLVSMFADTHTSQNWQTLENAYAFIDKTMTSNASSRHIWSCRVARPGTAGA